MKPIFEPLKELSLLRLDPEIGGVTQFFKTKDVGKTDGQHGEELLDFSAIDFRCSHFKGFRD